MKCGDRAKLGDPNESEQKAAPKSTPADVLRKEVSKVLPVVP